MDSITFRLRYRPIRIGWCLRAGDFDALRESLRESWLLCGGAHNPLIVVDDLEGAAALVRSANVDLLLAVREDPAVSAFMERFEHLPSWPMGRAVFAAGPNPKINFLDVISAAHSMPARDRNLDSSLFALFTRYEWTDTDPLSDVLLASCGRLPREPEAGAEVAKGLTGLLPLIRVGIDPGASLPLELFRNASLRELCQYSLEYDLWDSRENVPAGFFVGAAGDFWNLVNYWNFRAAGWMLLFYDPAHSSRLESLRDAWAGQLRSPAVSARPGDSGAIVAPSGSSEVNSAWLPPGTAHYPNTWGNSHARISIPRLYYPEHIALANVGTTSTGRSASMAVPQPPFQVKRHEPRNVALVARPAWEWNDDEHWTFQTPNIPLLNTYYGGQIYFDPYAARVETHGLAMLQRHFLGTLTLKALNTGAFVRELFRRVGIIAEPSAAGRVAARVIAQMGTLDDCRVFRVRGLRTLIEEIRPAESFTRQRALLSVREEQPDRTVGFDRYKDLYLEPSRRPQPEDVFRYMVSRGAFRVGLEFECTECSLKFWISLDRATASPECEYCGKRFDATPQLRDRDWRYRRSGVFGKDDSQLGAIPVALTLLRFLHLNPGQQMLYTPSLTLTPSGAACSPCETDFFAMLEDNTPNPAVQVLIGECKTRGEITQDDVDHLTAVADVLSAQGPSVFVVFAKLDEFTPAECARIARLNTGNLRRAIILTRKELEPASPYEWAEQARGAKIFPISIEEYAAATEALYLRAAPGTLAVS